MVEKKAASKVDVSVDYLGDSLVGEKAETRVCDSAAY